ncbi:MAG: ABC transporter permease subunit [Candidatus Wallbacteria bacterium]|nr:ABC transporter permease subunit [Candidatus Wallbacteria bacterium]
MRHSGCLALVVAGLFAGAAAAAAPRGPVVRFADVGWTDITATTALASELVRAIGVEPETRLLSLPVTFLSLENGDIDLFLGNWMPTQANDIGPYLKRAAVADLGVNLRGALYTFAVPRYVHEAGIRSAEDLASHAERFQKRIYGIEPGNEGNRLVLDIIGRDIYGLAGWKLVESSETGMLAEVRQAVARGEWIVFLGWRPHPMNTSLALEYLTDPREAWGPGGGASEVHTIASKRFLAREPELAKLFARLTFTVEIENELMGAILEGGKRPEEAAKEWLAAHPEQVRRWLEGVGGNPVASTRTGFSENPVRVDATGFPAAGPSAASSSGIPKLPLGAWIARGIGHVTGRFSGQLRGASGVVTRVMEWFVDALTAVPPPVMIGLMLLVTLVLHRSLRLALAVLAGTALIWNLGYWNAAVRTLALVVTASVLSTLIGVPIGIASARHPWLFAAIRPVLDMMQTIPTFVYLIPTLMLFGLGIVPGLISTVIFALPAPIRLTYLGVTGVPRDLVEAAQAFGARPLQVLTKVEIPHALPAILEGVTQALMLSLSMVVIAALVGAEGLGTPVVRALNTVDIEQGFEAGLSIVVVAILLDRVVKKRPVPRVRRQFGETGL